MRCAVVGISRDTGDNMVRVAEQFGNIEIEGKPILDVQPLKLLYAAAKPSTPQEVKEAVFSGDITTYKEYQDVMAQLKAEQERAAAAEAREEEAWKMQTKAEQRAKTAESQLEGPRQVAEAGQASGRQVRSEAEAARKQPIVAVVDKDEVVRQAKEMADGMTADYKATQEQDARDAYDSILLAGRSITNLAQSIKPLFGKLPGEQRENAIAQFVRTLGQIQGEVSRCL
ncbi:MAG: hypothetical protein ACLVES_08840 [Faecalibacterium prausnitzii]